MGLQKLREVRGSGIWNPFKEEGDTYIQRLLNKEVLGDFGWSRFIEVIRLEGLDLAERVSPSSNRTQGRL